MAVFAAPAYEDKLFSATSSSTFTAPPDFISAMKQFTPSSSPTFSFSAPNSLAVFATPAHKDNTNTFSATSSSTTPPHKDNMFTFSATPSSTTPPHKDSTFTFSATPSSTPPPHKDNTYTFPATSSSTTPPHKDNTFTFSATSSSTSSATKAGNVIHDFMFDDKLTNLVKPLVSFCSISASDVDQMRTKPVCEGYCLHIYDAFNSFFQRREFVVPPHIKEFCDLALEKYNNEKDTNYRYVCPLFAEEKTKAHVTTHSFLFKASASDSDPYAAEPFKAIITSGFRFSDGSKPSVKDLQQVSVVSVVLGSFSC